MTKTFYIHKSDCLDNETFEMISEDMGKSCFDEEGDPRDVDTLEVKATRLETFSDGCFTLNKHDIDSTTFNDILEIFEVPDLKEESLYFRIEKVTLD